jgi:transposase
LHDSIENASGKPGALQFVRWRKGGVWDRLLSAVSAAFEGEIVMIDSTCVRVHQHGATGKRGIM